MENQEKVLYLATLVFPIRNREGVQEVLLAVKKGKIGGGSLNGWGGGVEPGESLAVCACREFSEETGGVVIFPEDLEKVAVVDFKNNKADGTCFVCTVHVFTVSKWQGDISETKEMGLPETYDMKRIPQDKLMLADPHWLPRVLSGEKGRARAEYGPGQKNLIGDVVFVPVSSFGLEEE